VKKAIEIIKGLTTEPEVGAIYKGTIKGIREDLGAFVEILPGAEALLHISEIAHTRIAKVSDVLKEGEVIEVKVISSDRDGKIRLSRRELIPFPEGEEGERAKARLQQAREGGDRPPRRDGGRGDRRGPPRGRDR
jgi:polyribonucleotide nucleotidyltransferase